MTIDAVGQREQQYIVQNCNQANNPAKSNGRYSMYLPAIARNLNKLIVPLIFLFAMASLPSADGGPLTYSACCLACTASAPPAFPACITLCLVSLFAPSP